MAASLMPKGKQQFFNSSGAPLAGGRVYTFEAGSTTTNKATYSTPAATIGVQNANPVILDARGEATIFWSGSYNVVVKDASDSLIYSTDNYTPTLDIFSSNSGSSRVGFQQSGAGAVERTGQDKLRELKSFDDYGAMGDGVTADDVAIAAATAGTGPVLGLPGKRYKYGGSVAFEESLTLYDLIAAGENQHDTLRIHRDVSNVGTTADQKGGIISRSYVNAGVAHNEFGIFSVLNDSATATNLQNVSLYAQATSLTGAGSALWAGVFEVRNTTPTGGGSAVDHVLCGIEVDVVNALPYSAAQKKIGVEVIAFGGGESNDGFAVHAANDTYATGAYGTGAWRNGINIYANSINPASGVGIGIASNHAYGLQITGVSSGAAINLAAGAATTYGMTIGANYAVPISILSDKQIRLAHGVAAYGIEYASALTAVVLTAPAIGVTGHTTYPGATAGASGAAPAQVSGYMGVYVNGTLRKVPFYNA